MCKFQISPNTSKVFLLQLGIVSLIIGVYSLQSGIRFLLDKFLIYAKVNISAGAQGIAFFAIFITAGVILIIASRKEHGSKLILPAFLLVLIGALWSSVASLNFSHASFEGLLVWQDNIDHIKDQAFQQVIKMAQSNFCTNDCPCNSKNPPSGALVTADTSGQKGYSKYQDCPKFNQFYEDAGNLVGQLQELYDCAVNQLLEISYFREVNNKPVIFNQCSKYFDYHGRKSVGNVKLEFLFTGILSILLLIALTILGKNYREVQ